jgi:DNA-binding NarL/FixJ family response regulator
VADVTRVRTLLVDDVSEFRALLRLTLEESGFRVVGEAANGVEAIELAREQQPELVLLDVSMPVRDGMEALPLILAVSPASCVVMLSSAEADQLEEAAVEQGAAAYLEKGIEPDDLVRELRSALASERCGATPSPAA